MFSENLSSADNQQERPNSDTWIQRIPEDVGHYIAGFVEGEGSFNVPIRRASDRGLPWRISLSFNVSQVGRESPDFLRETFGVGTVRGRGDGVFYFEVTTPDAICERVLPFFERFQLRSAKARDLAIFQEITRLVCSGAHLNSVGFRKILELRTSMNRGGKRRRTNEELLSALENWESSETIRRPSSRQKKMKI